MLCGVVEGHPLSDYMHNVACGLITVDPIGS